jgi:hypothetical protein
MPSRTSWPTPSSRTRDGNFPAPDDKSFQAAAANANWNEAPGFGISLNNQKGAQAWPITSATFLLVHAKPEKPEEVQAALKFVDWAYKNGDKLALDLDYVPLPANVKDQVRNQPGRASPTRRASRSSDRSRTIDMMGRSGPVTPLRFSLDPHPEQRPVADRRCSG